MTPKNNYLLKTGDACSAARIDRNRFNEAVKSGAIDFAPNVGAGQARYFDENAEIALYIFARLMERSVGSAKAGMIANEIHATMRGSSFDQSEHYIAVCFSMNGSTFVKPGSAIETIMRSGETLTPLPYEIALYDLDNIRRDLMGSVDYLRRIVGGSEDE